MANTKLTPLSEYLITQFDKKTNISQVSTISVDPVVSEVATFYERIRTSMDLREEDVILRAAIERIIKRRLLLGGNSRTIAEPLVRELIWARYFPDSTVPESIIEKVEKTIDLYFKLQEKVFKLHRVNRSRIGTWIMQLMSSEIEDILSPSKDKELISNYIFQTYKNQVEITDDSEETKDAQVFIAIRRTYDKEDQALLRYHLFLQLFDHLTEKNFDYLAENFMKGTKKIDAQLDYPIRDKIYTYIKKRTIPFFILEDILKKNRGNNKELVTDEAAFRKEVLESSERKYENIKQKVGRAVLRGVIFILLTKTVFALGVEGSIESMLYGNVVWSSIAINTLFPPVLMIISGLMIKTPGRENSIKIYERISDILYKKTDEFDKKLAIKKSSSKGDPFLNLVFALLWILALLLGVWGINYALDILRLNLISKSVFIFFLTIVLFITYRVNQTAHTYTMADEKKNFRGLLFDFFFMPFIHVGRDLTENISKINILLFLFDLLIETPFKTIFAFFEQWFLYLRSQREKLG